MPQQQRPNRYFWGFNPSQPLLAFFLLILSSVSAWGCTSTTAVITPTPTVSAYNPHFIGEKTEFPRKPTATREASSLSDLLPTPTMTAFAEIGPEYLPGYHPLTGLPIADQSALQRNPLLVSITNFPPSARPQAGLSFAAQVWETSIGQGMTRFLAMYYGDYLDTLKEAKALQSSNQRYEYVLGPIRSGRIAYEEIKQLYPDSKLVIRYASYQVVPRLSNIVVVDPVNPEDVNSAGLTLVELDALTTDKVDPSNYAGMVFNVEVPIDGENGRDMEIIYNALNRVRWVYDPASGNYLRFQSEAYENGEYTPAFDRITGDQLSFENVLVLFARHSFENLAASILDIKLSYVSNHYGFLFRDGKLFPVKWSTTHGRLFLQDYEGSEIPFKPGKTFVQVVSYETSYDKSQRVFRFHNPKLPTYTPITPLTPTPTLTATTQPTTQPQVTPTEQGTQTFSATPTPSSSETPSPSPSSTP
jgi:hypothetical protein